MVLVFKPGDVLLGGFGYYGFRLFQPLGFKAERHLSMVAGTGTGKTTLLITMLGLHQGNAFVVDPKGQITKIIANRRGAGGNGIRGMGHDVAILDPNSIIKGHHRASWNAMDELARVEAREGSDAIVRYAMKMAEALVPMEGDKPYFPNTAREFLQGLILHVYTGEPPDKRNLVRVRDLLTRGYAEEMKLSGASTAEVNEHAFKMVLSEMQQNVHYGGVIANAAATMANTGRSYGDVLSTARSAMKFFDLPEIRRISQHSDFSLEDLKLGNLDLFICAPTGDVRSTYRGWFRLLCVMAFDLFEQIPGNLKDPCLFAIDEMPSLGNIEAIATSAPVMRGYGVRLLAITQDVEKLQKAYPDDWRGFLGNSDVTYWMGTNEKDTGKFLSEYLGQWTKVRRKHSRWAFWRWWRLWWARGEIVSENHIDLLTPQQVMKILAPKKENMILTRFGKSALRVKTMPYFKELPVYMYDPDQEHTETAARQWVRGMLGHRPTAALPPPPQPQLQPPRPALAKSASSGSAPARQPASYNHAQPSRNTPPLKSAALAPQGANQTAPTANPGGTPNSASGDITRALAVFGLHPSATRADLEKRKKLLDKKAARSKDFARQVNDAYQILARTITL